MRGGGGRALQVRGVEGILEAYQSALSTVRLACLRAARVALPLCSGGLREQTGLIKPNLQGPLKPLKPRYEVEGETATAETWGASIFRGAFGRDTTRGVECDAWAGPRRLTPSRAAPRPERDGGGGRR